MFGSGRGCCRKRKSSVQSVRTRRRFRCEPVNGWKDGWLDGMRKLMSKVQVIRYLPMLVAPELFICRAWVRLINFTPVDLAPNPICSSLPPRRKTRKTCVHRMHRVTKNIIKIKRESKTVACEYGCRCCVYASLALHTKFINQMFRTKNLPRTFTLPSLSLSLSLAHSLFCISILAFTLMLRCQRRATYDKRFVPRFKFIQNTHSRTHAQAHRST